jgi:hypothetical protein
MDLHLLGFKKIFLGLFQGSGNQSGLSIFFKASIFIGRS